MMASHFVGLVCVQSRPLSCVESGAFCGDFSGQGRCRGVPCVDTRSSICKPGY